MCYASVNSVRLTNDLLNNSFFRTKPEPTELNTLF